MPYKDPEAQRACARRSYERNRERRKTTWAASAKRRRDSYTARVRVAKKVPCADCGGRFHPAVMDFHHRDPSTKSFAIATKTNIGLARLDAEIAKCDVLCANCHRMRHVVAPE